MFNVFSNQKTEVTKIMNKRVQSIIVFLIAICLLCSFPFFGSANTLGDVDNDGEITASDARLALRCAVGLEYYDEDSEQYYACDVNKDQLVTAEDARLILRAAVGLEIIEERDQSSILPCVIVDSDDFSLVLTEVSLNNDSIDITYTAKNKRKTGNIDIYVEEFYFNGIYLDDIIGVLELPAGEQIEEWHTMYFSSYYYENVLETDLRNVDQVMFEVSAYTEENQTTLKLFEKNIVLYCNGKDSKTYKRKTFSYNKEKVMAEKDNIIVANNGCYFIPDLDFEEFEIIIENNSDKKIFVNIDKVRVDGKKTDFFTCGFVAANASHCLSLEILYSILEDNYDLLVRDRSHTVSFSVKIEDASVYSTIFSNTFQYTVVP